MISSRHSLLKNNMKRHFSGSSTNKNDLALKYFHGNHREKFPLESPLPKPDLFLDLVNNLSLVEYHSNAISQWNFESNITNETRAAALSSSERLAGFQRLVWRAATQYDWRNFNESTSWKRQFEMLSVLGVAALSDKKFTRLDTLINEMETLYGTATINLYKKPEKKSRMSNHKKYRQEEKSRQKVLHMKLMGGKKKDKVNAKKSKPLPFHKDTLKLHLHTDIQEIMATSEDPEVLAYVWKAWHDATGKRMKKQYVEYVGLMKEVARLNGFPSAGKYWTSSYDDPDFEVTVEKLWKEVKPLYLQLHAYVRNRIRAKYGTKRVPKSSNYIPAHLLGDMWAQSWIHIQKYALPYPKLSGHDLTAALRKKNYTPLKFFKLSEDFFHSIGFTWLPTDFWTNSIIERPKDKREMVCHGSAWDMFNGKDFRIKMCTRVTYEDLVTVHHEMGHVYYYIEYKDQPAVFREGANPGFHEAIGDTIALLVSSPIHTSRLGLTKTETYDVHGDMNFLFAMALQKVAFLPFAYCVDKWRWIVFGNNTLPDNYNGLWWQLRAEIQGIEPPIDRTKDDFDPGSKYHIAASVPYIRYFVSFIIQFQFLEAACLASGGYEPGNPRRPLHRCDLYGNIEGGLGLRQMMKLGSSKPWPDAMEKFTGSRTMQTKGLLAYFKPLYHWLQNENRRRNETVGF
ncbi:angiotensin-converting enzyme-like [Venturia canescens]|uniref:angiotensin-converting enzyme-like n=1 Tax=Venturia canescens TaxID=32260 RepID=UPI001C9BF102|nr:angiotensin-converting enzyme-like [Venturia canescens]